jgi:hypothetical protein
LPEIGLLSPVANRYTENLLFESKQGTFSHERFCSW